MTTLFRAPDHTVHTSGRKPSFSFKKKIFLLFFYLFLLKKFIFIFKQSFSFQSTRPHSIHLWKKRQTRLPKNKAKRAPEYCPSSCCKKGIYAHPGGTGSNPCPFRRNSRGSSAPRTRVWIPVCVRRRLVRGTLSAEDLASARGGFDTLSSLSAYLWNSC